MNSVLSSLFIHQNCFLSLISKPQNEAELLARLPSNNSHSRLHGINRGSTASHKPITLIETFANFKLIQGIYT